MVLTNLDGERARASARRPRRRAGPPHGRDRRRRAGAAPRRRRRVCAPRCRRCSALRDLEPLIDAAVLRALDVRARRGAGARTRVLATRAFERTRAVLARHRFAVLTGPPEMGKTAIARMVALAALTDGWEAHECSRPEQAWQHLDRDRPQVFIADDAFGSTEYRPDAAERWARELARAARRRSMPRHWLLWTSRPAPLKVALRRIQRERGAERFPAPGEVLVDAGELSLEEKTLILFRHAKDRGAAAGLTRAPALHRADDRRASAFHPRAHPPLRRPGASDRLPALGTRRPRGCCARSSRPSSPRPTPAMRASFEALEREHRDLLIALLDAPAGLIDERELAEAVRRHHRGGLSRPPGVLIDRLTDHFLRAGGARAGMGASELARPGHRRAARQRRGTRALPACLRHPRRDARALARGRTRAATAPFRC